MQVRDLICRKTNNPINVGDVVSVFVPFKSILIGWGWFEFNEDDGFWFREDYHHLFPWGMDPNTITNIFDYEFELK